MPQMKKLSRKAMSVLRKDARMKELYYNYNLNGGFNAVETIIFNQLISEAEEGTL